MGSPIALNASPPLPPASCLLTSPFLPLPHETRSNRHEGFCFMTETANRMGEAPRGFVRGFFLLVIRHIKGNGLKNNHPVSKFDEWRFLLKAGRLCAVLVILHICLSLRRNE